MADQTPPEGQYENRNESLRAAIDALAQHSRAELDQHGAKARAAREAGVEDHKIHYVLDRWDHLVEWRRNANADPLDPGAVSQAYDDDFMAGMASEGARVADGAGDVRVPIELTLGEAFRAMKLLPGDLGMTVFAQVLEKSQLSAAEARSLLSGREE